MSEYIYYEFQALDKPLTLEEQSALRTISTRADISSHRFQNEYEYGDLKADSDQLLALYFDVSFSMHHWYYWDFSIKLPDKGPHLQALQPYLTGDFLCLTSVQDRPLLWSRFEKQAEYCEPVEQMLSCLSPIRDEILTGDMRAPYLGWLRGAQEGIEDNPEPPLPAGLKSLSSAQEEFRDFLGLDPDLVKVASERSGPLPDQVDIDPLEWLATLSETEKDEFLRAVLVGSTADVRRSFLEWSREFNPCCGTIETGRTGFGLLDQADEIATLRRRKEEELKQERERERREKAAEQRQRYLEGIRAEPSEFWQLVSQKIAVRNNQAYDQAVKVLCDLREVVSSHDFETKIAEIRRDHKQKVNLMSRLRKAGL